MKSAIISCIVSRSKSRFGEQEIINISRSSSQGIGLDVETFLVKRFQAYVELVENGLGQDFVGSAKISSRAPFTMLTSSFPWNTRILVKFQPLKRDYLKPGPVYAPVRTKSGSLRSRSDPDT